MTRIEIMAYMRDRDGPEKVKEKLMDMLIDYEVWCCPDKDKDQDYACLIKAYPEDKDEILKIVREVGLEDDNLLYVTLINEIAEENT